METVKLEAQKRADIGKKASKAVRKQDLVPCNLYGGDANHSFSLNYNAIRKGIYTDKFQVFELSIDGAPKKAILKEVQFHPVTDKIIHVDFQELAKGKFVKTEIPLVTSGFAAGQKEGGKLDIKLRKIKIKASADNIPSSINIDVTPLKMGKSLRVKDIVVDGYEILNSPLIPIVSISIPRALRSASSNAAADAAAGLTDAADAPEEEAGASEESSSEE